MTLPDERPAAYDAREEVARLLFAQHGHTRRTWEDESEASRGYWRDLASVWLVSHDLDAVRARASELVGLPPEVADFVRRVGHGEVERHTAPLDDVLRWAGHDD